MADPIGAPTPFGRPKKKSSSGKRRRNLYSILGQITDRDMQLLLQLYEHKILTTHQIYELHFSGEHRARLRARQLYERGVLDRFRPHQHPGSQPHHYFLDDLGAKLIAGYLGVDLKHLRFRKERILRFSRGPFLRHLRETNGFFTRLAYACRLADEDLRLIGWYGERRAKTYDIRPDGQGWIEAPSGLVVFWLELDRGTESHDRLRGKLVRYQDHLTLPEDRPQLILFCFTSERREVRAREALWRLDEFTVATTTLGRHRADPLGPIWLPLGDGRRYPIMDMPLPYRKTLRLPSEARLVPPRDDPYYEDW